MMYNLIFSGGKPSIIHELPIFVERASLQCSTFTHWVFYKTCLYGSFSLWIMHLVILFHLTCMKINLYFAKKQNTLVSNVPFTGYDIEWISQVWSFLLTPKPVRSFFFFLPLTPSRSCVHQVLGLLHWQRAVFTSHPVFEHTTRVLIWEYSQVI